MLDIGLTVGSRAVRRLLLCFHQDGSVAEAEAERLHSYLARLLPASVGRLAAAVIAHEHDALGARTAAQEVDALVVVVGPTWRERVGDHRDPVRRAIEEALARGIPVVPIVVDLVLIPHASELPHTLAQFSRLSPVQLRYGETAASNARVVERLRVEMGALPSNPSTASEAGRYEAQAGCGQRGILRSIDGLAPTRRENRSGVSRSRVPFAVPDTVAVAARRVCSVSSARGGRRVRLPAGKFRRSRKVQASLGLARVASCAPKDSCD